MNFIFCKGNTLQIFTTSNDFAPFYLLQDDVCAVGADKWETTAGNVEIPQSGCRNNIK